MAMAIFPPATSQLEVASPTKHMALAAENSKNHYHNVHVLTPAEKSSAPEDENLLIVSPYEDKPHLLDLRTLDIPNQLLAKALVGLKCQREDYATAPYVSIFNWAEVVDLVHELAKTSNFKWEESSFYIVVFRSRIPPTTVYADLGVLDKAAHAEATESGGFLK